MTDLPELRALATRIAVQELIVTNEEVIAFLEELAKRGYTRHGNPRILIEPAVAGKIVEHLITECKNACHTLDLRLWKAACEDYLFWESDHSVHRWEALVTARVRNAARSTGKINKESWEDKRRRRRNLIRRLMKETSDREEQVARYTTDDDGGSRGDFYKRLEDIESGEFDGEEAA
jgi:hypothetical protein